MKTLSYKLLFILSILFTLVVLSCDDETDNATPNKNLDNEFVYKNQTYELGWGILRKMTYEDIFRFTITLFSDSVQFDPTSGHKGIGHLFAFEGIYSSSDNIDGNFTPNGYGQYDGTTESMVGLINECEFCLRRVFPTLTMEDEGKMHEVFLGTLNISKEDSIYTLIFDGEDDEGNTISLYYKGELISEN